MDDLEIGAISTGPYLGHELLDRDAKTRRDGIVFVHKRKI